jgi:hypothetical protein
MVRDNRKKAKRKGLLWKGQVDIESISREVGACALVITYDVLNVIRVTDWEIPFCSYVRHVHGHNKRTVDSGIP